MRDVVGLNLQLHTLIAQLLGDGNYNLLWSIGSFGTEAKVCSSLVQTDDAEINVVALCEEKCDA